MLEEIRSGAFARELIAEEDAGEPQLRRAAPQARERPVEQVGSELRALAGAEGLLGRSAWRRLTFPSRFWATGPSARRSTGSCARSADDIERATGHRLRVVTRARPRRGEGAEYQPRDGVLTTDFAEIREDDSIALVAEVMGGIEPTGELRPRTAARRQARRLREQAARRPARRRALRGRLGGRRPAPLRGERLRGDPGDQGAARGARRHERPPRPRHRQRDDELHPHRDGGAARPTTRRSRRRSSAVTPRPTRPTTSRARTPPRRWRSSPPSRSARASTLADVDYEGIEGITAAHVAAARAMDMVVRLVGAATLVDGAVDVRVRPGARRPAPSARRGRGRVQRRHAPGRRDPRDHARGPGRRRDRDGVRRRRRHGQRRRDDRHRLPPERRVLAHARASCRPASCRSPFYVHIEVEDRPGVLAHVARRLAEHECLDRAARRSTRSTAAAALAHRHARGARRARARPRSIGCRS